jgi:hypothetical protein
MANTDTKLLNYIIVNERRLEYIDPRSLGTDPEIGGITNSVLSEVVLYLLHDTNGIGSRIAPLPDVADPPASNLGRWSGDRVSTVSSDCPSSFYQDVVESPNFEEISNELRDEVAEYMFFDEDDDQLKPGDRGPP